MPRRPFRTTPRYENPDPNVRERRSFSPAEVRQQRFMIGQLWINGVGDPRRIADLLERSPAQGGLGYRLGKMRVEKLLADVKATLLAQDNATLAENKFRQRERLLRDANNARADKKWSAAIAAEKLISEIDGTLAPLQVNVDMRVQGAIATVLAELSPEDLDDLVEEQRAIENKARAYDALPAKVIEAEAVEVAPEVAKR